MYLALSWPLLKRYYKNSDIRRDWRGYKKSKIIILFDL